MLLTGNFEEPVLLKPAERTDRACNTLKIVSGFTDCERISTHLIKLGDGIKSQKYVSDIRVELILGMTKNGAGLSKRKHEDICKLMGYINQSSNLPLFQCRYISTGKNVHTKLYVWSQNTLPLIAYCGSLNYSMNAFYKQRECLTNCDPYEAYNYYESLLPDCINYNDPNAIDLVRDNRNDENEEEVCYFDSDYAYYDKLQPIDTLRVSLLRADGSETGHGSGVNWGIRADGTRRNLDQAYIPYNRNDRKEGFFPDRENPWDENCPVFRVITKEVGSFHMRMAQDNNKALHSAESNAILGEWLRKILNVQPGVLITKRMLENYGKTYVTFRKYEDGVYLLDF